MERRAEAGELPSLEIGLWNTERARLFLDHFHPLGAGGSLSGQKYIFVGYENGLPVFCAVFVSPRGPWKRLDVVLELSRLAWSPYAVHSAATFLKKCLRALRSGGVRGYVVTYAMPGTEGKVYLACGFKPLGRSSGNPWSTRKDRKHKRPDTVGTGRKLLRFVYKI